MWRLLEVWTVKEGSFLIEDDDVMLVTIQILKYSF